MCEARAAASTIHNYDSICASAYVSVPGCLCALWSHGSCSGRIWLHVLTNDGGIFKKKDHPHLFYLLPCEERSVSSEQIEK